MKTLYLVRHAKSSWEFDLEDHQRPLNDRGLQDAPLMGKHLREKISEPHKIISSDAVRAKTTALLYLRELGIAEEKLILNNRLYDFSGDELEAVIKNCEDSIDILMVFGHNNAMTYFVNEYGDKNIDKVSTAAFTMIEFNTDSWEDISNGTTSMYVKPKQLK